MYNKHSKNYELYQKLEDLKQARKLLVGAINGNFNSKSALDNLYLKLEKVNKQIKILQIELKKLKEEEKGKMLDGKK